MTKQDKRTLLFWIDLETTGLDEKKGTILEYAAVVTDLELVEQAQFEGVILQDVAEALANMDQYVREMHEKNGLLEALDAWQDMSLGYEEGLRAAEAALHTLIEPFDDGNTIFVIAGSTISFDRRWLKEHMPDFEKRLHYRQLDVSVYKVGFPEIFGTETSDAHRAMPDIRASIAKHATMRKLMLDAKSWEIAEGKYLQLKNQEFGK